ncbi:hypothetical protein [Serratia sp. Se-RSBMAAmG]|uniref:hypothetical protein n=1 Tax=Serratia sp. Se-RSBMAAmG TaxID=3043305 RepID=UPI0024AF2589|nr:hypothetical protein [Serratia sp. Se-RSBMAAmG]MDI6977283.1 hypothetical protein [Serratia sp. Se-RSBMAAmG]
MNASQSKQLNAAIEIFRNDPERLKDLFMTGRLRLSAEPMYTLYLYYMAHTSFKDITHDERTDEITKNIAKRFLAI